MGWQFQKIKDSVRLYLWKSGASVMGLSVIILILFDPERLSSFFLELLSSSLGAKDEAI
jgi:hypothetical protein